MATSLSVATTQTIDLAEFRRRVLIKVDPSQPDTLIHIAEDLVALSNNHDLLARIIYDDLRQWPVDKPKMYTPQSCLLDAFDGFSVRINLWKAQGLTDAEKAYFSYLSYHNHDFPFITANYYGPGYSTSIYEVGTDAMQAAPGDKIDIRFLEETMLPPGKVMYYRKWQDVHSQIPPTQDSASINLLIDNRNDLDRNQFYFDVDAREVLGRVENTVAKRLSALDFGWHIGSRKATPLLREINRVTSCGATAEKAADLMNWLERKQP